MSSFRYCKQFEAACEEIITSERATEKDIEFVETVRNNCEKTGFVSQEQGSWIGILHQSVVHEGKYVKDSWWT